MDSKIYRRHDISDKVWDKIASLLPGRKGARGRIAKDNRRFINGGFWIVSTGAPWWDLPYDYGELSFIGKVVSLYPAVTCNFCYPQLRIF